MGQAPGVAAATTISSSVKVRDVDITEVRSQLAKQGVVLHKDAGSSPTVERAEPSESEGPGHRRVSEVRARFVQAVESLNDLVHEGVLASPEAVQVLPKDVYDVLLVHAGLAAGMRGDDHVVHVPEGAVL